MANSQPFRTSPQLGPQLNEVFATIPYWDDFGNITSPSYKLGNRETGNDGSDYIWVQASAAIAATASTGTQVTVTDTGTAAAGSGGWYAPPAGVASGSYFHARSKAWNAY